MKKIAFTLGDFDCINKEHLHLLLEMRKVCLPDNEATVILTDDYASFVINGKFPIQEVKHRMNNLNYFCKNIHICVDKNPVYLLSRTIEEIKRVQAKPIFVAYDDNKDFPGREYLKEQNITIKFIRKPNGK